MLGGNADGRGSVPVFKNAHKLIKNYSLERIVNFVTRA